MPNPYRLLALGLFVAFGAATAGHYALEISSTPEEPPSPPALLAAAYANPAEIAFADTLRGGETLLDLLQRSEIAEEDARTLLDQVRRHGDPRRMREGSVVTYRKSYQSPDARAIQMRLDADHNLFMYREGEEWTARVEEVPVRADTVVLLGTVESTLAAALTAGDDLGVTSEERRRITDHLANRIFPGHIDFRRDVRAGSDFEIVYERLLRPDGTSRSGRVLAARFDLNGRRHEAFYFRSPEGREDYYNRRGESLRRIYFRAPLDFRRVSSAFSRSRFHPILGINRPHNGVDYAAAAGTAVRAVGDGVVRRAAYSGGYGNVVEIEHGHGYRSRYAHLRGFSSGMRPGRQVRQGEVIGFVGMTGLATGPHLHYEFHVGGRPVDPTAPRFVLAAPVPARFRSHFHSQVETKLATIQRWENSIREADSLRLAALYRTRQVMEAFD